MPKDNFIAIIPAAGTGARFGSEIPKQYAKVGHKTVLDLTLSIILNEPRIKHILVILANDDHYWSESDYVDHCKVRSFIGGETRMHSVFNGLQALSNIDSTIKNTNPWILVHDAARCCLHDIDLSEMIDAVILEQQGMIMAKPVSNTMKELMPNTSQVCKTVSRESLCDAETPQIFKYNNLLEAINKVISDELVVTDESEAIERNGESVNIFQSHYTNLKITTPEDLAIAKAVLLERKAAQLREMIDESVSELTGEH